MKSAQINKYGSSQAIEISNSTPEPSVAPGKVLVAIKALLQKRRIKKTTLRYSLAIYTFFFIIHTLNINGTSLFSFPSDPGLVFIRT